MSEEMQSVVDRGTQLATLWGLKVVGGIAILVAGWIIAGIVGRSVSRACRKSDRIDGTVERYLAQVARTTVLAVTVIAMLNSFGVQTASIIAVLGAMGLAIGLALQGTLSNVASGLMLLILRPFRAGDAVDVAGSIGIVQEIGLFATELRGYDGLCLLIPNAQVWGGKIVNMTRNEIRRVDLVVGISYRDDIGEAMEVIGEVLSADDRVLAEPEAFIAVGELGASSVDLLVRPWTQVADFFPVRCELIRRIKERLDAEGISIPFPQRDVHLIDSQQGEAA